MVHRHLGSARITYPTGVTVSPADPVTTAILPRDVLVIPGTVSRPVRLGAPPSHLTADQYIQHFLAQAGDAYEAATLATMARMADPLNTELRNAEHALFSRYVVHTLGPVAGRAVVAAAVPLYSLAKAVGQPVGAFKGATAPSWREVQYGLKPLLPAAPSVTGYATVGVWPGAVLASPSQCAAYITAHGGQGSCRAVYSNGTYGPVLSLAQTARLHGVGYYPNLGQDASAASSYLPAGVPSWVWYVAIGGVAYVILYALLFRGHGKSAPRVRTVTRTTY